MIPVLSRHPKTGIHRYHCYKAFCFGPTISVDLLRLLRLVLLLCLIPCILSCTPSESNSLIAFLSNLSSTSPPQGTAFPTWDAGRDPDCCLWDGVACDGLGSVTRLWLPFRGLKGHISAAALLGLPSLAYLNLSRNSLTGGLDPSLMWSAGLVVLDVSFNRLDGQVGLTGQQLPTPAERRHSLRFQTVDLSSNLFSRPLLSSAWWANTPDLVALNASRNRFTGSIPSSVCAYNRLQALDISFNKLNGSIPFGFGNCSQLTLLRIGNNELAGQIPPDLYSTVSLHELSAPSNFLSGNLDAQGMIANLANLSLLDFSYNRLTGPVPEGIGKLAHLQVLMLNNNQLFGSLPLTLSNGSKLRHLILRDNALTGELSTFDFSTLSELQTLDLGSNNFTGTLPPTIYSCKSLIALRLAQNNLSGEIEPEMAGLLALSFISLSVNKIIHIDRTLKILQEIKNLTAVILDGNFYGESMPNGITGFQNLRIFSLARSMIKGQVPDWLSSLTNLAVVYLSGNQLTGTVPEGLGSLPHLFSLDLSENLLTGVFPLQLTALLALTSERAVAEANHSLLELPMFRTSYPYSPLDLQYNQLYNLPTSLNLQSNNLMGAIPPQIGLLKMVQVLNLSKNGFSGNIPSEIGRLTHLETLDLSNNHLEGRIPGELSNLSFLSKFNVAHNELWGPIPRGGQFNTFSFSSFEGNNGLCGKDMAPLLPCSGSELRPVLTTGRPVTRKHVNKEFLGGFTVGVCFGEALALLIFYMLSSRKS